MIENLTQKEVAILIQARKICNIHNIRNSLNTRDICQAKGISRKTGYQWANKLEKKLKDREVNAYDFRDKNGFNEHMRAIKIVNGRKLSPEQKLKIYHDIIKSLNRSELAKKWGIDRNQLYQIIRLCDQILIEFFGKQKRNRKPDYKPFIVDNARSNTLQDTLNKTDNYHIAAELYYD